MPVWTSTTRPMGELVAQMFDRLPQATYSMRCIDDLGHGTRCLLEWGALIPVEPLRSIWCRACGDDHAVELEFDPETNTYNYFCASAGLTTVEEADIRACTFDVSWLLQLLEQALDIRKPRRRALVENVFWDL